LKNNQELKESATFAKLSVEAELAHLPENQVHYHVDNVGM
jgi:hypothetical protein